MSFIIFRKSNLFTDCRSIPIPILEAIELKPTLEEVSKFLSELHSHEAVPANLYSIVDVSEPHTLSTSDFLKSRGVEINVRGA